MKESGLTINPDADNGAEISGSIKLKKDGLVSLAGALLSIALKAKSGTLFFAPVSDLSFSGAGKAPSAQRKPAHPVSDAGVLS